MKILALTDDELETLVDAVRYMHQIAEQVDPRYDTEVWAPMLVKLVALQREHPARGPDVPCDLNLRQPECP